MAVAYRLFYSIILRAQDNKKTLCEDRMVCILRASTRIRCLFLFSGWLPRTSRHAEICTAPQHTKISLGNIFSHFLLRQGIENWKSFSYLKRRYCVRFIFVNCLHLCQSIVVRAKIRTSKRMRKGLVRESINRFTLAHTHDSRPFGITQTRNTRARTYTHACDVVDGWQCVRSCESTKNTNGNKMWCVERT